MAKGKHSTALFEVIHASRRPEQALRTPKWWFKSRMGPPRPVPMPEPPDFSADIAPTAEVSPTTAPSETPATASAAPAILADAPPRASRPLNRSAIQFDFDRARQEMTLRLRYTTAIVGGFAILVTVAMAYVVGRHISHGPQAAYGAQSTDSLLQSEPNASALEIPAHPGAGADDAASAAPIVEHKSPTPAPAAKTEGVPAAPTPGSHADTNENRSIGLNYIIVQSYPDAKMAQQACDFLQKQGVSCTIEKGPKDWVATTGWYSVMTTTGFQRVHSPEFEAAVHKVVEAGERPVPGSSHRMRFDPHPYRWKDLKN